MLSPMSEFSMASFNHMNESSPSSSSAAAVPAQLYSAPPQHHMSLVSVNNSPTKFPAHVSERAKQALRMAMSPTTLRVEVRRALHHEHCIGCAWIFRLL